MARAKTDKKLISFVNLDLCNRILKDRAEFENRSESSIVEQFLLGSMLSWHKEIREILISHLYSDDGDVKRTIICVLDYLKAGCCSNSPCSTKLTPLVQFAFCNSIGCSVNRSVFSEEDANAIVLFMQDIVQKLNIGQKLVDNLENHPQAVRITDIYLFVLEHIEDLRKMPITYNLLMKLVETNEWTNDCKTRVELIETINKAMEGQLI